MAGTNQTPKPLTCSLNKSSHWESLPLQSLSWKIIRRFHMPGNLTNSPQLYESLLTSIAFHIDALSETCRLHIHPVKSKQSEVLNQSLYKHSWPWVRGHTFTLSMYTCKPFHISVMWQLLYCRQIFCHTLWTSRGLQLFSHTTHAQWKYNLCEAPQLLSFSWAQHHIRFT